MLGIGTAEQTTKAAAYAASLIAARDDPSIAILLMRILVPKLAP
jgi:hypothetical protein